MARSLVCAMQKAVRAVQMQMLPYGSHYLNTGYMPCAYMIYTYPISSLIIRISVIIPILPVKTGDSGNMHDLPTTTQALTARIAI